MSRLILSLILLFAYPAHALTITDGAVTYTVAEPAQHGTYANGDPWVVGPVTLTATTPAATDTDRFIHGVQVNPANASAQGFDSWPSDMSYDDSLNVDPGRTGAPLALSPGDRVFKAVSLGTPAGTPARPLLDHMSVLTVVDVAPPAGAFRPPYVGHASTDPWATESSIDWAVIPSYPRTPSAALPDTLRYGPAIEHNTEWTQRAIHPLSQQPVYGGQIAKHIGDALLLLAMDFTQAEKRGLLIDVLQHGIDVHGVLAAPGRNGGTGQYDYFYNNGGHNSGRYVLALFTRSVLSLSQPFDGELFQDVQTTYYVGPEHIPPYLPSDEGVAEWVVRFDTGTPDPTWAIVYRDVVGSALVANAVAGHMHALTLDSAYEDYGRRYWAVELAAGFTAVNDITEVAKEAAATYWDSVPVDEGSGLLSASGQIVWTGGDAGEDATQPAVGVTGDLGATMNVDALGNWTIAVDGSLPEIQALAPGQTRVIAFVVYNADGATSVTVSMVINGTDDVPVGGGTLLVDVQEP